MELVEIFNVLQNRVVCWLEDFFSGQWNCWIWWSELVFLLIIMSKSSIYVDTVLAHYLCTLLLYSCAITNHCGYLCTNHPRASINIGHASQPFPLNGYLVGFQSNSHQENWWVSHYVILGLIIRTLILIKWEPNLENWLYFLNFPDHET
jgi:hypothetical protein